MDNEKMILIDFEYAGFGPIGYDIANYWNECVCDNQSLNYYYSNFPGSDARKEMCNMYLKAAHEQSLMIIEPSFESYWEQHGEAFTKSVEKLVLVNSFYWSVWGIMMLQDEHVCDDNAWQWKFIKGRNKTFVKQRKEFNL